MKNHVFLFSSSPIPQSLFKEIYALAPTKLESIFQVPSSQKCYLVIYQTTSRNHYKNELKVIKERNPQVITILLVDHPKRDLYRNYMAENIDYPIHIHNKHQNFLTNFKFIMSESKNQYPKLSSSSIELDPNTKAVTLNSRPLKLRKKEYELLKYLMLKKGSLVTKTELLENVWNYRYDIFTKTVDTHIHHLKKKVNKNNQLIRTVYGQGYKILDPTPKTSI